MSRRNIVAIASASVILFVGLVVAAVVLAVTQTSFGRERIRRLAIASIASSLHGRGSMYVGHISGNLFTGLTVDSVMIRDAEDSLFVATGPIRVKYDPRDLLDKRLRLSYLELTRPVVYLRRHADRSWNYQRIFPSGPKTVHRAERQFGDYIVIDSVVIHDGTFLLTEPWSPPDSLGGARLDSAVRVALSSPAHEIRRTREGLKQTRRWTRLELRSPYVRITDPDTAGRFVQIGRLDVEENDPPFRFRNVRGPVRILGDSVWLDVQHFDLPGSTGEARGKVWWGGDLPTRYDVHVVGDSVSLADIAWVYPTLPRVGGGTVELTIRNDPRNLHVLDYALTKMDMRADKSRLRGAMTFGVGGPVLVVKDVALEAAPVDFDLLRTLAGGPFPVDWQGQFTGSVRASGGPLNRWQVDDARLTFRDGHVPGAVTTFTAHGGLDILSPANAIFRGLQVNVATLDLRTPQFLFPSFPSLKGTISGRATLDSIWTDVRFSNADLTHHDGPGGVSHVTGRGRITYGENVAFDVDLDASPLAFTTLARSYPALAFRGPYSGPLRAKGTTPDFELTTALTGAAGQLAVNARIDMALPGYAAQGTVHFTDLDLRTLLERPAIPVTRLTGTMTGTVRGDSIANLDGTATIALDRSRIDSLAVDPSAATLAFGGGRVRVDSLRLETSGGRIAAHGALGLSPRVSDTLHYVVTVDSLGGLRPYLRTPPSQRGARRLAAADSVSRSVRAARVAAIRDSLDGTLTSTGVLVGSIDTLMARGTLTGYDLFVGGDRARTLAGEYDFRGLPSAPVGSAHAALDSLVVSGVRVDSAAASLTMQDRSNGLLVLRAASGDARGAFHGAAMVGFQRAADNSLRLVVDSAGLQLGDDLWSLTAPAHILLDSTGVAVDSMIVRAGTGRLAFRGTFPTHGPVDASLTADSIPLGDVGTLAQTTRPLGGVASLALRVTGERENPVMHLTGQFADMRYGEMHFPYFTVRGDYADQRAYAGMEVYRSGTPILAAEATLPVDLALTRVANRTLDDSLRGRIRADSVDLGLLEALSPQFAQATGTATTTLDLGGTWDDPTINGRFLVKDAAMGLPRLGIRLRDLNADVAFTADSIMIHQLAARSGGQPNSSMSLTGTVRVPNYRDLSQVGFNLAAVARNFQAIDKRALARLELSGNVQLSGTFYRPVLAGNVSVDRGALYISDITQKQVVNLNDPEFYNIVDTSLVANRGLLQNLPPDLDSALTHLSVPSLGLRVGDDVWLRSEEANIKLAGNVDLRKRGNERMENGTLQVTRGTYRLDLGVVQRTFQVDSGRVVFYGDPHIPAELNIYATYVVRQANRELGQDVRIIAHIGGTLQDPRLDLSSQERIPLSNTEILSYLVFGQPSFASTSDVTNANALRPVASVLLPSVGAVLERALTDQISFIDYVQVQTGSTAEQDVYTRTGAQSVLGG
ncbi:MAG: translocation/assembly module TamB domain-containing protein, partial [Gemmatimonadaceae bacterium]|nr:translocation/assembly module TamB domain-containing protein [Gemmatimonadaceae bacterium]